MSVSSSRSEVGRHRILVIDLEPTPYKTDLWNAFAEASEVDLFVVYTEKKNWAPDAGHNYLKWPAYLHAHLTLEGKGLGGRLSSACFVAKKIFTCKTDLIFIAGYVHLATVIAIVCAIALGRRFVVHADEFNNERPQGRLAGLKRLVRASLRKAIFWYGDAVLVCGRRGVESASLAGCQDDKILDFPYVIDAGRMKLDQPEAVPEACGQDLDTGATVIFFSGRMIPRKGLPTLLAALTGKHDQQNWVLWIEGDGPELEHYKALAREHGLQDRCRFLGFCQYDLHSWLIRSCDIVVVPSLIDTWGIVVDEGIQLGKAVISSDATGSGFDRIEHGRNGFLFPAGDVAALGVRLYALITDRDQRAVLGRVAMSGPKNYGPSDNLATLLRLIDRRAQP